MFWRLITLMNLLLLSLPVYADDIFATGWGHAFDASAEGQLLFTLMQTVGVGACIRSLYFFYKRVTHSGAHTYPKCAAMFVAGVLLFYPHTTLNLFFNSF